MKLICSFLVISVALFNNSAASPVPQEDAGCPSFCPAVYAAVCGTDGKTYDSECQLKSTACKTEETIFVDYEGDCVQSSGQQQRQLSTTEKSCNGNCDKEYEPVCGTDGKTYNNICFLEFTDCQAGPGDKIKKATDGPCPTGGDERQGKSGQIDDEAAEEEADEEFVEEKPVTNPPVAVGCKNECAQNFKPVCGSDTKTYKNECLLDFAACENTSEKKLVKVSNGICPELTGREGPSSKDSQDVTITTTTTATPGACNGKCNRDFKPVCGSDGVTYNNDCLLEFAACKSENGKKITKASAGRCREGRQEEEDVTVENPFLQQTDEVKNEETALPLPSQTAGECNANCVREFKPICGTDGVTYNNKCLLDLAACKKTDGEKISEAHTGRCREDRFGLPKLRPGCPAPLWLVKQRRYLKRLPQAELNRRLTGDPALRYDPVPYDDSSHFWTPNPHQIQPPQPHIPPHSPDFDLRFLFDESPPPGLRTPDFTDSESPSPPPPPATPQAPARPRRPPWPNFAELASASRPLDSFLPSGRWLRSFPTSGPSSSAQPSNAASRPRPSASSARPTHTWQQQLGSMLDNAFPPTMQSPPPRLPTLAEAADNVFPPFQLNPASPPQRPQQPSPRRPRGRPPRPKH